MEPATPSEDIAMDKFFNPESIAVVGASDRRGGYNMLGNLRYGYTGRIYPVSPKHSQIDGLDCYKSVAELPEVPDLTMVLVPARVVPDLMRQCADKGIKRLMIQSAGFAEIGEQGRALQEQAMEIARQAGIRVWGPNCMGLVDVVNRRLFTFMQPGVSAEGLIPGRISLVVQSGMLAAGFINDCNTRLRMGVSKVCSIGNKADLDESDFLEYLLSDPQTEAVALYLESIKRGRRFAEIAAQAKKPVVVLKSGRSAAGSAAAMSHTSSLAGNSGVSDGALKAAGVTLAQDFSQMMEMAATLAVTESLNPRCAMAILTFSGSAGVVTCDMMEEHDIPLAELADETKKAMDEFFPDWAPVSNPVDLYPAQEIHGRVPIYNRSALIALDDPNTDVILIHYVAGREPDPLLLEEIKAKADANGKVAMVYVVGPDKAAGEVQQQGQEAGVMVFRELGRAIECLAAAAAHKRRGSQILIQPWEEPAAAESSQLAAGGPVWDEFDSKRLLAEQGIPVVSELIAGDADQALAFAEQVGYPVVLKGLLEGQVHKTEHGLVKLNLRDPLAVADAFAGLEETIAGSGGKGRILVQQQVSVDYELIVGFLRDAQFGPCVMFGLGGILSELQKDVRFTLAPLSEAAALSLMDGIRGKRLLDGFRSIAPLERAKMAQIIRAVGELGARNPEIEQIDLNPVIVSQGIPSVVDATIILG